ncbi:PREDICTED: neural Wiskott-Aldrich syndrome protein-like isoform X2 [Nicrophorus vespilloides]|uniref:Neural Wiskott-Aldrich syndrome protein-like isoform X2 n=1 Tax=Nicrophorus vespilloides TaxID=110193 RepID=A0ABM1NIZ3_NICVS|nr:PREDICTED: neural Wiskott-Aldrich syndrome protein-like isoform X2 [Nicrophorus vespilloides]
MPQPSPPQESKFSNLLSVEENQQIVRLLGPRCLSLATTVVQLFETQPPMHAQWIKRETGVLCFIRDNSKKNYFFRLYCFKQYKMIWEQEMYNDMDYIAACAFWHTFEGDKCMVCFNFANESEAREMKTIVDSKIMAKRKRAEKKLKHNAINLSSGGGNGPIDEVQLRNNRNNNSQVISKYTDPAAKKAKRRRNITKADIGKPSEFRHISHVGWDPNKGFDVNSEDADLNNFLNKAGVSEIQLKDRETRQFIYDFIVANGGRDAVLEQESKTKKPPPPTPSPVPGPPVPPRGAARSSHNRAAPPPPPTNNQPPPRPPPATPKGNAPPPPPPPPPAEVAFTPPMPPAPPPPTSLDIPTDGRSALLESIRGGTTLKPVEVDKKVDDARGDLLSEIRKGFQLKPANEREVKPISPAVEQQQQQSHVGNDLAAALSRALAERNRVIHPDDDDDSESSDSNDDEWDA